MITINRGQNNIVILTLYENTTIPNPNYLFEFTNDVSNLSVYFIAQDVSTNVMRYNEFNIDELTGIATPVDLYDGKIKLQYTGFWTYHVYQQTSATNLDPVYSEGLVEDGKVNVIDDNDSIAVYDIVPEYGVFTIDPNGGLTQSSLGLAIELCPDGGLEIDDCGLRIVGDINFDNLNVQTIIGGTASFNYLTATYAVIDNLIITGTAVIPGQYFDVDHGIGKGLTGSEIVFTGTTMSIETIYNTQLSDSFTMPSSVGGLTAGNTVANLKTKNFVQLFDDLLFPTIPPTYTPPTATLAGSPTGLRQIGVTTSVSLSISYIQNDGGSASIYSIKKNTVEVIGTQSGSNNIYDITPTTNNYTGTVQYVDGPIKNDNKGNPYPTGRILAGTVSTTPTRTVKTIFPYIYGKVASTETSIDATIIESGTYVTGESNTTITISFATTGLQKGWFAIPVASGSQTVITYGHWFIDALNQGLIGGGSNLFGSPVTVNVTINGVSHDYNYYLYNYGSLVTGPMQLLV